MDIVFSDNKQASAQLTYVGGLKNLEFEILVRSDCFEFETRASFLDSAVLEFRKELNAMYVLMCQHILLSSEDGLFRIEIFATESGKLNCALNIKGIYGSVNANLKLEEDLSYIPEIICQIDEVLNNLFDYNDDKGENFKVMWNSDMNIELSEMKSSDNKKMTFLLISPFYKISRDIEITKEEEKDLYEQLKKFDEDKKEVSFFPLGEFAEFVLRCRDGAVWVNGSICDYQYPYNSIDFNVPCNLKIQGHSL